MKSCGMCIRKQLHQTKKKKELIRRLLHRREIGIVIRSTAVALCGWAILKIQNKMKYYYYSDWFTEIHSIYDWVRRTRGKNFFRKYVFRSLLEIYKIFISIWWFFLEHVYKYINYYNFRRWKWRIVSRGLVRQIRKQNPPLNDPIHIVYICIVLLEGYILLQKP